MHEAVAMSEFDAKDKEVLEKMKDVTVSVEAEDEDEEDDAEEGGEGAASGEGKAEGGKKKKRNKKKKKKSAKKEGVEGATSTAGSGVPEKVPHSRILGGFTDYYVKYGQTEPPTIPVADLFPRGIYPECETLPHGVPKVPLVGSFFTRETQEEKRFVQLSVIMMYLH